MKQQQGGGTPAITKEKLKVYLSEVLYGTGKDV
jgi:hypothetical protein